MTLRQKFTDAEVREALDGRGNVSAAAVLTGMGRGRVSRQLVRHWRRKLKETPPLPNDQGPRISILDIETAPVRAAVWGLFKQNVGLNMIRDDWFIMSFAHKWFRDEKVVYLDQSKQLDMEDDTALLIALHKVLDEADIVVAHNGRKFDLRKINARFIAAGMTPPSPYRIVDTLETAKRQFAFTSNKLEWLTGQLCTTKKLKHGKFPGFELWDQCLKGNPEAWEEMREYNIVDILSLEELYELFLPWDDRAPNYGNFVDEAEPVCPRCGSRHVTEAAKPYRTNVGLYKLYQCDSCHGWARGRTLQNSAAKRKTLMSGV